MDTQLADCLRSYLTGSEKSGAYEQFTFEGEDGYLDGQKISKVVTRGTKRYLLIYMRIHYLCDELLYLRDELLQMAGRLGVDEIVLPDAKLLDNVEEWDAPFFEWYAEHIVAAARAAMRFRYRYRATLANRIRHRAKSYATALGLDWDSVAHRFTPDYVLKDDPDLLAQFALYDMGVKNVYDDL